jgi:tetratricopeptide (TPR) repeat protein
LNRFEEAATQFERSSIIASSDDQKADAFYNMANTFLQEQNLEGAIENYKQAIKLNPADMDARRNLYLAKLMQKQQQEQEQQQQQQQQQEQQQEQDQSQSEDQQQQEQQENDESQQQEEQQQSEESQVDNNNEESAAEEAQELNKEDAENLLQIIENEEKRVQEKLRKVSGSKKKPEKDW